MSFSQLKPEFNAQLLLQFSRFSYLLLVIIIPIWSYRYPTQMGWLMPLIFWWLPLLFALPGIFQLKRYAMTWANFILLIPFSHAIMVWLSTPLESRWAMTELILTSSYFICFMLSMKKMAKNN
ncbi:MAG TPA: DUF2069 domain-containing protein [Aeromonadales bacterium]|nr:DUF2069 domain-containing protein [Aeromonadales bacterium]